MEFHPDKCKVLRITNKRKLIIHQYHMHNKNLEEVDEAKYLGIIIHKKLSWKPHVNSITKKANQTRAFLQRNLRTCSREVKVQCYKTYVRPIIEYASPAWDPVGEGNKALREKLDMVQRKAARFVFGDWRYTSSPSSMIVELDLQSLQARRTEARLKFMHKYLYGGIDIQESFVTRARCSDVRLKLVNSRVQAHQNSFIPTTIAQWNILPSSVVNQSNFNIFSKYIQMYE